MLRRGARGGSRTRQQKHKVIVAQWFSVFVIVPVIGLVIWGLNTFWLHRLKKGDMDYSPEGFRKRARIFAIILAAVLLGVPLLAALLLWNRH